jgi:hypothetical protein
MVIEVKRISSRFELGKEPEPYWQVVVDYGFGKEVTLDIPARNLPGLTAYDELKEAQDGLRRLAQALLTFAGQLDKRLNELKDRDVDG